MKQYFETWKFRTKDLDSKNFLILVIKHSAENSVKCNSFKIFGLWDLMKKKKDSKKLRNPSSIENFVRLKFDGEF